MKACELMMRYERPSRQLIITTRLFDSFFFPPLFSLSEHIELNYYE